MSTTTPTRAVSLLAALMLFLGTPVTSFAASFDLTANGDFGLSGTVGQGPLETTKDGVTLSLTALTQVDSSANLESQDAGSLHFDPLAAC